MRISSATAPKGPPASGFAVALAPLAASLALGLLFAFGSAPALADDKGHDAHAPAKKVDPHAAPAAHGDAHASPALATDEHAAFEEPDAHGAHAAEAHGAAHGEGHDAHAAGGHGEHEEHEHAPHEISSFFDAFKSIYKEEYKLNEKLRNASWKLWSTDRALAAAKSSAPSEAKDEKVVQLLHEKVELDAKVHELETKWEKTGVLARVLVFLADNKYGSSAFFVVFVWTLLGATMYRARSLRPKGWGAFGEMLVGGFYNLFEPILGKEHVRQFFPFLATLFCFIFFNNLLSITPGFLSPSANFFNNFGLGILVFLYVQYTALTMTGPKKYLLHLMGDPPPNPKGMAYVQWAVGGFLLLPLEVLGEFIKPVSLSLRLFGNIMGEDILLFVFCGLGISIVAGGLGLGWSPIGLPMHVLVYPLILLGSAIQALVFTLLTTVYISLKLPHGHHEEGHEEAHAH